MLKEISLEEDMLAFGGEVARAIKAMNHNEGKHKFILIFLKGLLGAGKTTFARGFLRELGVTGKIKSPTYTLVEPYDMGERQVFHFDLYRINDPAELHYIAIQDYFVEGHICLIEWPEQGKGFLPEADLTVTIEFVNDNHRKVHVIAETKLGHHLLSMLEKG